MTSAATTAAVSAAHAGETAARLGFTLTGKALNEETALVVIPLLALEATAIFEGLSAYADTQPAWVQAGASVAQSTTAAEAHWS